MALLVLMLFVFITMMAGVVISYERCDRQTVILCALVSVPMSGILFKVVSLL